MKIKEMLSTSNTAFLTSAERYWFATPTSPLKARITPTNINKVCRSHLYFGLEINRIKGLLKGAMISLLVCITQNYQINTSGSPFYTKPGFCYTKWVKRLRTLVFSCFSPGKRRLVKKNGVGRIVEPVCINRPKTAPAGDSFVSSIKLKNKTKFKKWES